MEYGDHLLNLSHHEPALAEQLASVRTLEHVLAWMQRRGLSLAGIDVVAQDEFSHDLLVPLDADGETLSFGMT